MVGPSGQNFEHYLKTHVYNSNALENITRRLIGQRHKFATAYSVIYCRKPDVMRNVACDWST